MDYVHYLYSLLPKGSIWPTAPADAPEFADLITSLAAEPARIHADADIVPLIWIDIPDDFLVDFERILSLDAGELSNDDRRAAINALLAANQGISLSAMQSFVSAWNKAGAVVTDHDYPLFKMNVGAMGDPLRGEQWAATFTVTYPGPADPAFEASITAATPPQNTVIFVVV